MAKNLSWMVNSVEVANKFVIFFTFQGARNFKKCRTTCYTIGQFVFDEFRIVECFRLVVGNNTVESYSNCVKYELVDMFLFRYLILIK